MPEKNGVSCGESLVLIALPAVTVVVEMFVTKYSSLPTLMTAF